MLKYRITSLKLKMKYINVLTSLRYGVRCKGGVAERHYTSSFQLSSPKFFCTNLQFHCTHGKHSISTSFNNTCRIRVLRICLERLLRTLNSKETSFVNYYLCMTCTGHGNIFQGTNASYAHIWVIWPCT